MSSGKIYADVFTAQGTPIVLDSAQFVFQPLGVAKGNNLFTSWQSLVDEYNLWKIRITSPTYSGSKRATIVFDDTYAPISIPTLSGSVDFDVAAETSFVSLREMSGVDQGSQSMTVSVEDDVVWSFDVDPDNVSRFQSKGISWQRVAPGALTWLRGLDPAMTKFEISIQNGGLTSASSGPVYTSLAGRDLSILLDQAELESTGGTPPLRAATGTAVSLSVQRQSLVKSSTLSSPGAIGSLSSSLDPSSQAGPQPDLVLPNNEELNGPAASSSVRPGPGMSVLTAGQLSTYGLTDIPQVLQAMAVGFDNNPADGNTLSITDGTITETFTFLLVAANPFEVQIGGSVTATLSNLVSQINADSVPWKSDFFENPQASLSAATIIRRTQSVELYPDRVYGTFGVGVDPFVMDFVQSDETILLSYSSPDLVALPGADPVVSYAGFSTVSPLLDGSLVTVINSENDGVYEAQNPLSSGSGRWVYVSSPAEGPLFIGVAGVSTVNRQTRLVVAALAGGIAATALLPSTYPVGFPPLCIRRTDSDGLSTLTLLPSSGTIDGVASVQQPVASGRVVSFDGTDWHTVGNTSLGSGSSVQTLVDAPVIAFDVANGLEAIVTITANRTLGAPSNAVSGDVISLEVVQDVVGGHTFNWPASFPVKPEIRRLAGQSTIYQFRYDGADWNLLGGNPIINVPLTGTVSESLNAFVDAMTLKTISGAKYKIEFHGIVNTANTTTGGFQFAWSVGAATLASAYGFSPVTGTSAAQRLTGAPSDATPISGLGMGGATANPAYGFLILDSLGNDAKIRIRSETAGVQVDLIVPSFLMIQRLQ